MAYVPVPEQRRSSRPSQDDFTSLCHDLRQYVTAGLLLTQLPRDSGLDRETLRRLDLIRQSLLNASELLEQASRHEPAPQRVVDLPDLVAACVDVAESSHGVLIDNESLAPVRVEADPVLLRRAIDNMIDNARRAVMHSGTVVIRVGALDDEAWIEVTDDGPGFGQIQHGTGQGLSVIYSAARACGGRLEISSGPGPGTSVRVILPLYTGAMAVPQQTDDSEW